MARKQRSSSASGPARQRLVPQRPLPPANPGLPGFATDSSGRSRVDPTSTGGGTGRGVTARAEFAATPLPNPPPTQSESQPGQARVARGREHTETAATVAPISPAPLHASALYRLMAWLSPAYPVGAFSYSSGIEWAVEAGDISNADTLARWLAVMMGDGGGFCDAVLFVHAHRAVAADDPA